MKNQLPQGLFRKLILHFNIDKTIVIGDSLKYNNTDFMIRQILSELIWGRPDVNKAGETIFKVEHKTLEFDRANVEPELISYNMYLEEKYKPMTEEEYNALETKEAIDTLSGKGEPDVVNVCTLLGAYMLKMAGKGDGIIENIKTIQSKIDSGEGLAKFKELVGRQWGETRVIDEPEYFMKAKYKIPVNAMEDGFVSSIEAKNIGQAVVNLGGGRMKKDDEVDYFVGIEVLKKIGDEVKSGEPLLVIHANDETKGLLQVEFLRNSYNFSKEPVKKIKEILDVVEE